MEGASILGSEPHGTVDMIQPGNRLEANLTGPAEKTEEHAVGRALRGNSGPYIPTYRIPSGYNKKENKCQCLVSMQQLRGLSSSYIVSSCASVMPHCLPILELL